MPRFLSLSRSRAYKEDIGKYYNMKYKVFEDGHYCICHDGWEVRHIRIEMGEQDGLDTDF